MTFAEKVDLLMIITNTSNSVLARSISIDASAISRLRRGIRTPARNVTYLQPMAEYFARNCRSEYQKAALYEALKNSTPPFYPAENESIDSIIYNWLCTDNKTAPDSLDEFMNDFIHFQFRKMPPVAAADINQMAGYAVAEIETFYGKEGKQNAVLAFLSLVIKNEKPQTLLLYSDEDMEWLTDPKFRLKWATLMVQVITQGNRIKIIHSVTRNFDEMLAGIRQWVPLYMTGAIEPYYYPKTRDGLFRQTFFIAPETAAVTSSSVSNKTINAANLLFTNKNMLGSLIEEFNDFLALCRPLMRIFTSRSRQEDYLLLLDEFENETGDTIIKTDSFSDITMPPAVLESLLTRISDPAPKRLLAYHLKRMENFKDHLAKYCFTEIFTLPEPELIWEGKVGVSFSDILNDTQIFYTPEEYIAHLKNIIDLLNTYENYHIMITRDRHLDGSMIYVKEDIGVLVGKTLLPSIIFAINETNMTAAFWDYMNTILNKKPLSKNNRAQAMAELETLLNALELNLSKAIF